LADRRLARAQLAGDLGLDDPRVGPIATAEDLLQEPVLHLAGEHAPGEQRAVLHDQVPIGVADSGAAPASVAAAAARTSTVPADPSTRIRSPVRMRFVATDVPTTAGMPNSRDSTAGWEVVPPVSVTRPAIFVNSTTQ